MKRHRPVVCHACIPGIWSFVALDRLADCAVGRWSALPTPMWCAARRARRPVYMISQAKGRENQEDCERVAGALQAKMSSVDGHGLARQNLFRLHMLVLVWVDP